MFCNLVAAEKSCPRRPKSHGISRFAACDRPMCITQPRVFMTMQNTAMTTALKFITEADTGMTDFWDKRGTRLLCGRSVQDVIAISDESSFDLLYFLLMTEREQIEMDVVFVGAGPANLAAALSLKKEIAEHDDLVEKGIRPGRKIGDLEIAIVEKGPFVGAHILSGAVMDPVAIRELMPDFIAQGCPVDTVVTEDAFWYLADGRSIESPIIPPPLKNKGKYIVSLSRVCEWLGEKCEEAGINIFTDTPAAEVLYDEHDRVVGVRTGDKGIGKDGEKKPNYEPGVDLLAKINPGLVIRFLFTIFTD